MFVELFYLPPLFYKLVIILAAPHIDLIILTNPFKGNCITRFIISRRCIRYREDSKIMLLS